VARKQSAENIFQRLHLQLGEHEHRKTSDPQANPIKLLAYDVSKDVEGRHTAFRDIESIVKSISDNTAIDRANRLKLRAGVTSKRNLDSAIKSLAKTKAKLGFKAFKAWVEHPGHGIVFTAHPTFSLSRDIRQCLGDIASKTDGADSADIEHLKTLPYLPKRAPTLKEEHEDTQNAIENLQHAMRDIDRKVLEVAKSEFPQKWTTLTPALIRVYSWVGYDIDGRTDITWGDAIRLRLLEKSGQLERYLRSAKRIQTSKAFEPKGHAAISRLVKRLSDAHESALRDLELFNTDLTNTDNLVAAANNLTRGSTRRFLNLKPAIKHIEIALKNLSSDKIKIELITLKVQMRTFGLGTSRIHFRLNTRHVVSALKSVFNIKDGGADNRTLLMRASKLTHDVKPQSVNFASLALEKSTAHRQMILTAQIHKYIDDETPIRFLIAECEDSLVPLGMLYLARLYGVDKHLDISPLFETADALNNGGRIIDKMISNPVYRQYIEARGHFAIQTGFSDAGRFMGQIPATLAIERLHSHFASVMHKHKVKNVTSIVFNTHGEGLGRGGHPGTMAERLDYVMSPWAMHQFEKRSLKLTHETSFQGGDGFLWFQTETLARASLNAIILSRYADRSTAQDDMFYTENDFTWDIFRTLTSEQESLYADPNYVNVLGGFGQNLLIPTGSRAAKRAKKQSGADMFDPRQLRAIPHNAILQQFGCPANIFYGLGRAAMIDTEKFSSLLRTSDRARSIFSLAITSMQRTNLSILTAYGRIFDPGFWVSRALSGNEVYLADNSIEIANTLTDFSWRSQIMDLANRLRIDLYDSMGFFERDGGLDGRDLNFKNDDNLKILHALRVAVIMKMMIIATELPAIGEDPTSRLNILKKLQTFQIDSIISDLQIKYPSQSKTLDWVSELQEKTDAANSRTGGFIHISETIIKPLRRGSELVRQITIAITHQYDAFG